MNEFLEVASCQKLRLSLPKHRKIMKQFKILIADKLPLDTICKQFRGNEQTPNIGLWQAFLVFGHVNKKYISSQKQVE